MDLAKSLDHPARFRLRRAEISGRARPGNEKTRKNVSWFGPPFSNRRNSRTRSSRSSAKAATSEQPLRPAERCRQRNRQQPSPLPPFPNAIPLGPVAGPADLCDFPGMAEIRQDPPAAAPPVLSLAASRLVAPPFAPGSVWLVGAGPGDPGLLTLYAVHALATADVVLHDALVPEPILALAATTRLEAVGKRAGSLHTSQFAINQRLIALAEEGLRVLRLKSGDPCIFGRGGEEALALLAARVPFRLVPGVSAGLAAPALAGIPLTHRRLSRSVAFITARDCRGGLPQGLDWQALARGAETLVFFMGRSQVEALSAALIAAGRAPDEAVVFIANASLSDVHVERGTLAAAAAAARRIPADAPTLIVVGPTLALAELLAPLQQTAPMRARTSSAPALPRFAQT
jgi:uroporphyrin-III C-methyltransferase